MPEDIHQLQRRVRELILDRAEIDPQWRRQYIEDPQTAMEGIPEARQLHEMYETMRSPTEDLPEASTQFISAQEEHRQVSRSLTEKVLDRAASDPTWKQQLLSDPEAALQEANFPELERLDEIRQEEEAAEVRGQLHDFGGAYYIWYSKYCYTTGPECGPDFA